MGIVDDDSLFTNIMLKETIYISANTLFVNTETVGLSKMEFKEFFSLATKESFTFNGKLDMQVDGVAMGSSLGRTWLMLFLYTNWLQNYPSDFKPHYYGRYVDDVFVLFISPEHSESFQNL